MHVVKRRHLFVHANTGLKNKCTVSQRKKKCSSKWICVVVEIEKVCSLNVEAFSVNGRAIFCSKLTPTEP